LDENALDRFTVHCRKTSEKEHLCWSHGGGGTIQLPDESGT
jgi:hypothetical protein